MTTTTATSPEVMSAKRLPVWELVIIVAGLMAMNALAIDIILPALGLVQDYFQFEDDNQRHRMIVLYLMGMGASQLFYGPLIDRFGRKPVLACALIVYILTSVACVIAQSYELLLLARLTQGASAGATRVVAVAVVRDSYAGRDMARLMSIAMLIFMAAPIVAPSVGMAILNLFGDWHAIFWGLFVYGIVVGGWAMIRLPETLAPENKTKLDPASIYRVYKSVASNRLTLGYSFASAFTFAALFSYINACEQIFTEIYNKGDTFPLWFAAGAGFMACSNLSNATLVKKYGMRRLSHLALILMILTGIAHVLLAMQGQVSFTIFFGTAVVTFFCLGFVGPNFSAIAMEPVGHIAGTASALYGFLSTFLAATIGGMIAGQYDGTTLPIFAGNTVSLIVGVGAVLYAERGKLFQVHS